jgi:hypothetical protein
VSEGFFSKVRLEIEEQKNILLTFATRTDISQNDKAILLKAEYYLLRLSRVLYANKIDSAFRFGKTLKCFQKSMRRSVQQDLSPRDLCMVSNLRTL